MDGVICPLDERGQLEMIPSMSAVAEIKVAVRESPCARPPQFTASASRAGAAQNKGTWVRKKYHDPGFLKFAADSGLPFRALEHFKSAEMEEPCDLFLKLAERIWDPKNVLAAATGAPSKKISVST
ncbi:MAG: hypothetical protein WEB60_01595 [Terrimicrobiaceae bacterium]